MSGQNGDAEQVPEGERRRRRRAAEATRAWWSDPGNEAGRAERRQLISEGNRAWWNDPANAGKKARQRRRVAEANRARWNDRGRVAHRRFWVLSWALSGDQVSTFAGRYNLSALPAWITVARDKAGLTPEETRLVCRAHAAARRSRGGFDAAFTQAELRTLAEGRERAREELGKDGV
ncbi:hypothetical protein ACWD04_32045 [Streptomyces sp. NPDC002911]